MATELKIVTKVDDTELQQLSETVTGLDVKTVALGNISADVLAIIAEGFVYAVQAGVEYQNELDAINGKTETFVSNSEDMSGAFAQLSATILDAVGTSEAYQTVTETLVHSFEWWTAYFRDETIPTIQAERKAIEESIEAKEKMLQIIKKMAEYEKEYNKELAETARQAEKATSALARYEGMLERNNLAHKKELAILRELVYVYEEQGRSTDELIEKIEKMEATNVNATKTVRELAEERAEATRITEEATQAEDGYTDSIEKNTDSMNENTSATESNNSSQGQTFQSSGQTISGAESYARHALGFNNGANDAMSLEWTRYLKQIADSTSDTNAQIAGY